MQTLRRHGLARHGFCTISVVGIMVAQIATASGNQDGGASDDVREHREPTEGQPLRDGDDQRRDAPGSPQSQLADKLSPAYVARKQYLNGFLIRDREYRILLSTATSAVERGDVGHAVEALQAIWDAPQDVLVWDDGRQRPVSVHHRADELMNRLPDTVRDAYERCYGGEAGRLLESVLENHDPDAERELLRRFGHTRAAGRLLEYQTLRAMDRGELDEAAGYWQRLLADQWQQPVFDMPPALKLCERTVSPPVTAAPADGNGRAGVSPPVCDPLWTRRFFDDAVHGNESIRLVSGSSSDGFVDELEDVVGAWAVRQRTSRLPMGGASSVVLAGDTAIVRDFEGVAAFHLPSGAVRWRFRCESSLCEALSKLSPTGSTPSRDSRRRTTEAELFAELVADHSILATLTTDGRRVYVIDGIGRSETRGQSVVHNRLVALSVDGPEQGRPIWSRGGRDENLRTGMDDFYFLGPPQPHQGNLYVIGEQNQELQVVVLDAATGTTRWKQPISLVDMPVAECKVRLRTACRPLLNQGIVVCPTQMPILVGLDAGTGSLLWVYHAEGEEHPDSLTWPQHGRGSEPDRGAGAPVLAGSRILFLPQNARRLHCVDILSGRNLWCADACQTRFVACAVDELVMLVNSHECVGLNLENGKLLWRTPIDAPAGRGVLSGDRYLLPLNSGRLAEIRLADGYIVPNLLASPDDDSTGDGGRLRLPETFCGNLVAHNDLVVCCSPTGLTVFPQARPLLDRLQSDRTDAPLAAADCLLQAQLHMQLGEGNAAIDLLHLLLAMDAPDVIRQTGIEHLRELLYVDFDQNPSGRLEELAGLVSTPDDAARYLLYRLQHELNCGLVEAAVRTTNEIRELHVETPVRMDHAARHRVRPLELARFTLEQFRVTADDVERERLAGALRASLNVEGESDARRLREAVLLLRDWTPDRSLSRRLARQLTSAGDLQAAESLTLSLDPGDSMMSTSAPPTRPTGPAAPGEYAVSYGPRQAESVSALEGIEESWQGLAVEIREIECPPGDSGTGTEGPCSKFARLLDGKSHFLNATGMPVRLLQTESSSSPETASQFAVIARDGFTELGTIDTPSARWRFPESGPSSAGHLVPLRGDGVLMLSLLEHRRLWHVPQNPEIKDQKPLLGPFGVDFCVLQSDRQLSVVDPVTGRPLWTRQGLRYEAGLPANEETGIIGDRHVVVVFDADRIGYELFETRCGESLGRGELPTAARSRHLASFGRRLMYRTEVDGVSRIRIWDPLSRRMLLDEPADGHCCYSPLPQQQRVGLLTGHRLKSIEGTSGVCEWELDVAGEHLEHVRKTHMFSDGDVDFVLLERHMRDSPSNVSGLDIRLPSQELSGDLYAVRRASGEPLWSAPLPVHPAKVLLLPHLGLPFLVTVSRVRDARDNETYRLKIDVIDLNTGRIACSNADLPITPILHASREPENGTLTLWGADRRFEIGCSGPGSARR